MSNLGFTCVCRKVIQKIYACRKVIHFPGTGIQVTVSSVSEEAADNTTKEYENMDLNILAENLKDENTSDDEHESILNHLFWRKPNWGK